MEGALRAAGKAPPDPRPTTPPPLLQHTRHPIQAPPSPALDVWRQRQQAAAHGACRDPRRPAAHQRGGVHSQGHIHQLDRRAQLSVPDWWEGWVGWGWAGRGTHAARRGPPSPPRPPKHMHRRHLPPGVSKQTPSTDGMSARMRAATGSAADGCVGPSGPPSASRRQTASSRTRTSRAWLEGDDWASKPADRAAGGAGAAIGGEARASRARAAGWGQGPGAQCGSVLGVATPPAPTLAPRGRRGGGGGGSSGVFGHGRTHVTVRLASSRPRSSPSSPPPILLPQQQAAMADAAVADAPLAAEPAAEPPAADAAPAASLLDDATQRLREMLVSDRE